MIALMVLALAAVAWLSTGGPAGSRLRLSRALQERRIRTSRRYRTRKRGEDLPILVVVQQLAALLRGGRSPSKLWEELWIVHGSAMGTAGQEGPEPEGLEPRAGPSTPTGRLSRMSTVGPRLSRPSLDVLAAARAAAAIGAPTAEAIRSAAVRVFPRGRRERRVWCELAACLDVAETSGCPLADVLSRFCMQLEAEDDADAARQTALAGPKATVRMLGWLPILGLLLGMALGVDPLGTLLGSGPGLAALAAGLVLTAVGRIWSSRLVAAASGEG